MSALGHVACWAGFHLPPERYPYCPAQQSCPGHCPRCGTRAPDVDACRMCRQVDALDTHGRCPTCVDRARTHVALGCLTLLALAILGWGLVGVVAWVAAAVLP